MSGDDVVVCVFSKVQFYKHRGRCEGVIPCTQPPIITLIWIPPLTYPKLAHNQSVHREQNSDPNGQVTRLQVLTNLKHDHDLLTWFKVLWENMMLIDSKNKIFEPLWATLLMLIIRTTGLSSNLCQKYVTTYELETYYGNCILWRVGFRARQINQNNI